MYKQTMNANKKNIVMLGASGAVGGEVLRILQSMPTIGRISLLNRRDLPLAPSTQVRQHVVDVFDPASYSAFLPDHHAAICTFGVGQPSKVSRQEFLRVDKHAVLDFATACKQAGVKHFSLLGSVASNAGSRSFYLRSKGELAAAISELGFERFSLFQPSMILTPSNRYGASQAVLLFVWPLLSHLLVGGLSRYRGIHITDLAASIAKNLEAPGQALEFFQWQQMLALSHGSHAP